MFSSIVVKLKHVKSTNTKMAHKSIKPLGSVYGVDNLCDALIKAQDEAGGNDLIFALTFPKGS